MNRALGVVLGVAADAILGDPQRHHPVAWFGSWANRLDDRLYADSIGRGAAFTAVALAPVALLAVTAEQLSRRHPIAHTLATATATWVVLGAKSLAAEGQAMADELDAFDLPAARQRLTHLCSRNPDGLEAGELARGTIESLAENTADAVVASLLWGAIAGIPGLLLHRGVNTLDAMVGYRNLRYERFGKVSARLDDVAAYLPARLTGALSCLLASSVGGSIADSWRIMRRDAGAHPSPNGGWTESAWAGVLDVRLGGSSNYHGRIEQRPLLGNPDAAEPSSEKIRQATRLLGVVTAAATTLSAAAIALAVADSAPSTVHRSAKAC